MGHWQCCVEVVLCGESPGGSLVVLCGEGPGGSLAVLCGESPKRTRNLTERRRYRYVGFSSMV